MKKWCFFPFCLLLIFLLFVSFSVSAEKYSGGRYTVGKDIPAGEYSVSLANEGWTYLTVWGKQYDDYSTDGGLLLSIDLDSEDKPKLGKVILKEGNVIDFDEDLIFKKFQKISFDPDGKNTILGGHYTVGKDIPAGHYSVEMTDEGYTWLDVWGKEYNDYETSGGLLLSTDLDSDKPKMGKVILREGNVIDFTSALTFKKYRKISFNPDQENTVLGGRYTVGKDIPAGEYSIAMTEEGSTSISVWGKEYKDNQTDGGHLLSTYIDTDKPGLGKVILREGNVIDFTSALTFKKYRKISFDPDQENTVPGGRYTVGKDIPAGAYSVETTDEGGSWLSVWGNEYHDYDTGGGQLLSTDLDSDKPKMGKVILREENVIDFTSALTFKKYRKISFDPDQENTVLGGRYTVGKDIPAGEYSIAMTDEGSTIISVWGKEYKDYQTDGGRLLSTYIDTDKPGLGKVILKEGNIIDFTSALIIKKYQNIRFDPNQDNIVLGGQYTVGKDIPAGIYSVTMTDEGDTWLSVWGKAYNDYDHNGGCLLDTLFNSKKPKMGKVILKPGNVIVFQSALLFRKYTIIQFDPNIENTVLGGRYVVGVDIPEGTYTISMTKEGWTLLSVWGKDFHDYVTGGGCLFDTLVFEMDPQIKNVYLRKGNMVDFDAALVFLRTGSAPSLPVDVPKTGDSSDPILWIAMILLGLTGIGAVILHSKEKAGKQQQ